MNTQSWALDQMQSWVNTVSSHLENLPLEFFLLPAETALVRPLCVLAA